jgi:superfamily II DNA helicase RecQ
MIDFEPEDRFELIRQTIASLAADTAHCIEAVGRAVAAQRPDPELLAHLDASLATIRSEQATADGIAAADVSEELNHGLLRARSELDLLERDISDLRLQLVSLGTRPN